MASETIVAPISVPASADLTSYQFRFMRMDSNGQLALPPIAGGPVIGVLQDTPNAQGRVGQICGPGSVTKVVAGASITKGYYIATDTNGKAVQAVSGNIILGQAEDSGSSGDRIRLRFMPLGRL